LKAPPKLAAGSRQNSQAGGLRYVAQPSRLRVRGASEPHVPPHRQPTDGGTIKRPHPEPIQVDVDRERIAAPSPPTQTGQAVLPHPAFQFVASDGLAQALDSWASEESHQPRRLAPRSPDSQAVHCQVGVPFHARFSGASGRSALRHYPDPCGMQWQRLPTPRPCPPSLHDHYSLLRYYEDSDPDRPFGHRPWFPDSRHSDFRTFHLQPSAALDQTRSTPSTLAALFCSGFALALAGSPEPPTESSSLCPGTRTALRTVRSLPVALHPGVWPRRSYFQLLALQCRPGQGLSPCCPSALSGARARDLSRRNLRTAQKRPQNSKALFAHHTPAD